MYHHLLDGDTASNTLGWRWAAGLHTRGKAYPAQAANISQFTNRRFMPKGAYLTSSVGEGLIATEPDGWPPTFPLRSCVAPDADLPTTVLSTNEDWQTEDFLSCRHLRLCSPLRRTSALAV